MRQALDININIVVNSLCDYPHPKRVLFLKEKIGSHKMVAICANAWQLFHGNILLGFSGRPIPPIFT